MTRERSWKLSRRYCARDIQLNLSQLDLYAKLQFADKEVASVTARYKSQTYFDPPDPDPQSRYEITYSADAKVILLSSKLSEVT